MNVRMLVLPVLSLLGVASLCAADWRPVTESERTQKTPRVDPAADAEAVFWDIKLEDSAEGGDLRLAMNHYIRIKIFTDRGREKYATVEIPQLGKQRVSDVAGRTIKPDGSIAELKKDAIFDRELVKTKGYKARGKTFTMPNVEVGDIIEYRYKETHDNELASHMRLHYQRDLPMWNVTYHIKPLQGTPFAMRSLAFHCKLPPFQKEPGGFYAASLTDMPAFQEESYMPPEDQLRAWVLIYYEADKKIDAEKYWKEIGKDDFNSFKPHLSADGLVKRTALEIVSGAEKPEDKLAAIDTFCRTKIRNLNSGASHPTAEERKAIKENKSSGDTLKQKAGTGFDVNLLFAALANAAGLDARMVRLTDRGDTFFTKSLPLTYFLHTFSVGVKVNDNWSFFDPATPYLERGMLRWQEELGQALVSDPKEGFFVNTPYSEPARSTRQRRATLKLMPNGALEGTVRYTYSGHAGRFEKSYFEDMTPAQQEEDWKKSLQSRLSTAEMTDFAMKDAADPMKPIVVEHNLTVPGYATRTGKRILFQPAFFQRNLGPRFTESKRKWDLYFNYGWAEDDEVVIDLPEGWELDQPMAPVSTKLSEVGNYSVEVRKSVDGRQLIYKRKFEWGSAKRILLPMAAYATVKQIFDFVQEQDAYTIALKATADAK